MVESNPTGDPAAQGPTLFDSLAGIFLDPSTTFQRIKHRPSGSFPA